MKNSTNGNEKKLPSIKALQKFSYTSLDGFFVSNTMGRFMAVNASYCNIVGYTREELLAMSISDIEAKETPKETKEHIQKLIANEKERFETLHRRKDGSLVDVEISATYLVEDNEGFFMVFVRDLTQWKQAEAELKEYQEHLENLVEVRTNEIEAINEQLQIKIAGQDRAAEELRQALRETLQREKEISALYEGSRVILELRTFQEASREIFHVCKNLIGATSGYIAILKDNEKENEVLFVDTGGVSCSVDPALPMPIRGFRAEVYRAGKTLFNNNFSFTEWLNFLPSGHAKLENVMFAPLIIDGKAMGLLGLGNKPGGFTENDACLATSFGGLAAIALYNDRTFELLRDSEERFRSVAQSAADAMISVDSDSTILFWNNAAERIFGYLPDEIIGKSISSLIPVRYRQAHENGFLKLIETGKSPILEKTVEVTGLHKDGREFPLELSIASWNVKGKMFFTGIIRDITMRRQIEESLNKSREELEQRVKDRTIELEHVIEKLKVEVGDRKKAEASAKHKESMLASVLESLPVGVWVTDEKGLIVIGNKAGQKIWSGAKYVGIDQYGEFKGWWSDTGKRIEAEEWALARAITKGETSIDEMIDIECFDGTRKTILNSAVPIRDANKKIVGAIVVNQDMTDRKRLQDEKQRIQHQLFQSQKMESIGILAGGVAHDFNNLLTIILGYVQVILEDTNQADSNYYDLQEIEKASMRAANLTRQLLLFSRKQPMESVPLDFNETIDGILKMLRRLIGEDIAIHTEMASNLSIILADPGNIEQVIMNLTVNARDAMEKGGELTIKTENVDIDNTYCQKYIYATPGKYVCFSVKDTGAGMDEQTLAHIFEPFFTTKGLGKGTGLGLSVVYGIAKEHKGWINVFSAPGEGSTFKVYFPVFSGDVQDDKKETDLRKKINGKGGRILVVEDEEALRKMTVKILHEKGYILFEAASSQEALDVFDKEKGRFDLVFTDVILPDQTGIALAEQILSQYPEIPFIFVSGYTDQKSHIHLIREKGFRFIQKPYRISDLLTAISEVI